MRSRDWSSDVGSSGRDPAGPGGSRMDLADELLRGGGLGVEAALGPRDALRLLRLLRLGLFPRFELGSFPLVSRRGPLVQGDGAEAEHDDERDTGEHEPRDGFHRQYLTIDS